MYEYKVQLGDNLYDITTKFGKPGFMWRYLFLYNRLKGNRIDKDLLFPGQNIYIPERWMN